MNSAVARETTAENLTTNDSFFLEVSKNMSSDTPPDSTPEQEPSDSPARDRFQAIAKERMESGSATVERSLWQGGYSAKAMYGTWVISGVLTIVGLLLVGLFASEVTNIWLISGAVILIWWCIALAMFLYRRFGMHYELTTQRFIHQAGILVRRTDRIEVIDIEDVSYVQGIIQRMLGVGSIKISGRDRTHPELFIKGIDKVPEVAGLIDDVRREERRRRSLHIESS